MSDYQDFLAEMGVTEATARAISENLADQVTIAEDGWRTAPSLIEGTGLFASRAFAAGQLIAPARLQGMRTQAGRYANHARDPNAKMQAFGPDIYLIAERALEPGDEITVNYRQAVATNVAAADPVLAELKKLNRSLEQILCFQKFREMRK
jgi:hypothetical protein